MALSGYSSFCPLPVLGIILLHLIITPGLTDETTSTTKDHNMKRDDSLTPEELERFGHLGKLGEQGEILRGQIDELDYFPNGKDFYQHFIRKRKPLIMRGVARSWPAFEHWKNETYMREKYGDVLFEVDFTKTYEQKFPIKNTLKLKDFLDIYKTQEVYLDSAFPQSNLTKDIPVPYCLLCEELSSNINSVHLLYSSGNTSYVLHQDGYENLLTVLSGRKVLLIADSSYSDQLHANEYVTVFGLSPIDPERVDLTKYPKVAGVPFHEVVLEAGDILYSPQLWWHQVRSYDSPNIAISLWFLQFKVSYDEQSDGPDIEDVSEYAKMFEAAVDTYPETIACRSQNQPLGSVFWPTTDDWDSPSVEKYKIGMKMMKLTTGYEIPMLGFGTGFLVKTAKRSTLAALKTGYRLIDTATAYNNEEAIGEAILLSGVPRKEIVIVDKIHPKDMFVEGATVKSVDDSLEKLKVDYIDIMLLHSKDCDEEEGRLSCDQHDALPERTWEDAWRELETTVESGKVRSIGVSNFEVADLQRLLEIAKIKPALVQNLFDPFIQDREVRDFCQKNNIVYMSYSTLGRSWFDVGFDYNPVLNNSILSSVAAKYDASVAQVVLRWAMWENVVTIPRSSNTKHIALNFASQFIPLNEQDISEITRLQGQISEDEISDAVQRKYPDTKNEDVNKTAIIENPSIVVEREVNPRDLALYFGSDDHWIYAMDGVNGQLLWKHQTADETGSVCALNNDESVLYCGADDTFVRAFHPNNGSLAWKYQVGGPITSSVRVSKSGNLFFGCLDNHFYCISASGELQWKKNLHFPVWATPAFAKGGELVFVGSLAEEYDAGTVFAFDGETGSVIWSSVIGGIFASPAIDEKLDIVVFCTIQSKCYGLRMSNGEHLWVLEVQSEVYSSPSIQRSTGTLFISCLEGTVYAVNIKNGFIVWKKSVFIPEVRSSPLVLDDGRMFIATGAGMVLLLNSSNGDVVWSKKLGEVEIFSSPKLATTGMVYIGTIEGSMVALNATNGDVVWKTMTGGPVVATVRVNKKYAKYSAPQQQFNE